MTTNSQKKTKITIKIPTGSSVHGMFACGCKRCEEPLILFHFSLKVIFGGAYLVRALLPWVKKKKKKIQFKLLIFGGNGEEYGVWQKEAE